ncbi:hypothetical protein HJC23_001702 [Cyclotella cryptica]|uniref:ACT domain-containing protein n=1 Tax=Cyclotella cryptica TaxID=29204 RepID=A0ABD3QSB7_9STRA
MQGIGQIFSGIGGVVFGDALEELFHRIAPGTSINMTKAQRNLRLSRSVGLLGGIVGVTLGCALGLVNLFFVDEYKASLLKLHALEEGQEFEFEVEVDNEVNPGYTTVIVRGPDVDGVLASITACIASCGCSVAELHAGYRKEGDLVISTGEESTAPVGENDAPHGTISASTAVESLTSLLHPPPPRVEDIFLIRDRSTQQALENEDLENLGQQILAAAKDPLNSHSLKSRLEELQFENDALAERVLLLERMLESRQIKVVRSVGRVDERD